MRTTILIGFGNPMRGDDGAGSAIIDRLRQLAATPNGVILRSTHQLVPELAVELAQADRVIFLDARIGLPAGRVELVRVVPAEATPMTSLGHQWTAETLLAVTRQAFGRAPRARAYTIGVATLEPGERLSPLVAEAVERLAQRLARRCSGPGRQSE